MTHFTYFKRCPFYTAIPDTTDKRWQGWGTRWAVPVRGENALYARYSVTLAGYAAEMVAYYISCNALASRVATCCHILHDSLDARARVRRGVCDYQLSKARSILNDERARDST